MNLKYLVGVGVLIVLAVGGYLYYSSRPAGTPAGTVTDYKAASFLIDGERVSIDGAVTKYFGNEARLDLNADGREDVAFIITREPGGSGTFYYAVAAINTPSGYVGSDGYLLGDRIAPQATSISPNPQHKSVVVFNYADRRPTEPMSTPPSVGKSVYLKLDQNNRWGIVEPNFTGEAR